MTCHSCKIETVKAGRGRNDVQRWKCQQCGKRFSDPRERLFGSDSRLPDEKITIILHCLVEGNAVRGTARLCDVEKRTVLNLLMRAGENSERLFTEKVRNVKISQLQADEIWTFVQKKEGHKGPEEAHTKQIGDAYTFIGLDRSSKLVVAWHLGKRDVIGAIMQASINGVHVGIACRAQERHAAAVVQAANAAHLRFLEANKRKVANVIVRVLSFRSRRRKSTPLPDFSTGTLCFDV